MNVWTDLPSHSGLYKRVKEDHGFEALKTVRHYVNTACRIDKSYPSAHYLQPEVLPLPGVAQRRDSDTLGSDSTRPAECARSRFTVPCSTSAAMLLEVEGPEDQPILSKNQLHHALGSGRMAAVEEHRSDTHANQGLQQGQRAAEAQV